MSNLENKVWTIFKGEFEKLSGNPLNGKAIAFKDAANFFAVESNVQKFMQAVVLRVKSELGRTIDVPSGKYGPKSLISHFWNYVIGQLT